MNPRGGASVDTLVAYAIVMRDVEHVGMGGLRDESVLYITLLMSDHIFAWGAVTKHIDLAHMHLL